CHSVAISGWSPQKRALKKVQKYLLLWQASRWVHRVDTATGREIVLQRYRRMLWLVFGVAAFVTLALVIRQARGQRYGPAWNNSPLYHSRQH
ncbi:MAG: hypothetical protein ONB49_16505, partial [candidate division KSB1 bacterium]|nr:hypothetical protein [candidate division KSB1 bacterium]